MVVSPQHNSLDCTRCFSKNELLQLQTQAALHFCTSTGTRNIRPLWTKTGRGTGTGPSNKHTTMFFFNCPALHILCYLCFCHKNCLAFATRTREEHLRQLSASSMAGKSLSTCQTNWLLAHDALQYINPKKPKSYH